MANLGNWYDVNWKSDEACTHGGDGGCRTALRAIVATLLSSHGLPSLPPGMRAWATWYLAHHCANCGACDDLELLGSDGMCDRCRERTFQA
jgi:hypothetical protein